MRRSRSRHQIDVWRADLTAVLLRAAAGDADAERAFVQRTVDDVERYCRYLVGAQRCEDAVQTTYMRAFASLGKFRGEAPALTWLIGVARYTCFDVIRSSVRRERLAAKISQQPSHASTSESLGGSNESTMLDEALRWLARTEPERFEAFVLTQVLGFSYADAAHLIDCPIGTVRSRVARARSSLATWWQADEDAPTQASS